MTVRDSGTMFFILLVIVSILFGIFIYTLFQSRDREEKEHLKTVKYFNTSNGIREIEVIDGCEYIANSGYNNYTIYTHKGNCTNVIHKNIQGEK